MNIIISIYNINIMKKNIQRQDLYFLQMQLMNIYIFSPPTIFEWLAVKILNINVIYFDEKTKMLIPPFITYYKYTQWFIKVTYEKLNNSDLRLRFNILGIKLPSFLRHDDCILNKNGDYDCTGHALFMPFKFKLINLKNVKF